MKNVKNLLKSERRIYPNIDKKRFEEMCETLNFVKGEYVGFDCASSHPELCHVLDHVYMFKNEAGKKFYVANSYAKIEEMVPVLVRYDLLGDATVLGTGFWDENSTLVVVREKTMKRLRKELCE